MKKFLCGIAAVFAVVVLLASTPPKPTIPDFTCGYDGKMLSGFKNGNPVCTYPAGFLEPNLKCDKETEVLVGLKDGRAVCKEVRFDWTNGYMNNVYGSDSAILLHVETMKSAQ